MDHAKRMSVDDSLVVKIRCRSKPEVYIHTYTVSAAIPDCQSLLKSPRYTSCEFAMVECLRFAVKILMIYVIVWEIIVVPVLAVMLDFRHEVASTMIFGDADVSYVVVNPCIVFGTTCISVKSAKLLVLPVVWLPYKISGTHRRPMTSAVPLLESLIPKI